MPRRIAPLVIGSTVPPFEGKDMEGKPSLVDARAARVNTVFYVFTPDCVWCGRNLANVQAIAASAGERYRLIGISLDPNVQPYLRANNIDFPVLVNPSAQTIANYKLGPTPTTIVVAPSGDVVRIWQGAYGPDMVHDVATFFGISLPGLQADDRSRAGGVR
ncbi:MAG TPA: TlpA disulfide reductase family protein [Vicinamibacterales bacterium]